MRRTGKQSESPYNEVNTTGLPCKGYIITKNYVTAHDPDSGKRWRLKGALYGA